MGEDCFNYDSNVAWVPVYLCDDNGYTAIDSGELYEAATVDGATAWQQFRKITLPLVLYATAPILITQYTFNFNNFSIIYLFNGGGPAVAGQDAGGTDILISWIYKLTMTSAQYGKAAALTMILSLIVITVALWQFKRTKSFQEEDMM